MSIRHLFLSGCLLGLGAGALPLPLWAQTAPAATPLGTVLHLPAVLEAARQNPDALAAKRAADAARADVRAADRAPAPVLSAGVSSIDLRNGNGGGSFWTQKRLDKSLGLDWTWERGNKRGLRTEAAERAAQAATAALAGGAAELGVATVGEALELRAAGITAPLLAWLHPPGTDFAPALTAGVRLRPA